MLVLGEERLGKTAYVRRFFQSKFGKNFENYSESSPIIWRKKGASMLRSASLSQEGTSGLVVYEKLGSFWAPGQKLKLTKPKISKKSRSQWGSFNNFHQRKAKETKESEKEKKPNGMALQFSF